MSLARDYSFSLFKLRWDTRRQKVDLDHFVWDSVWSKSHSLTTDKIEYRCWLCHASAAWVVDSDGCGNLAGMFIFNTFVSFLNTEGMMRCNAMWKGCWIVCRSEENSSISIPPRDFWTNTSLCFLSQVDALMCTHGSRSMGDGQISSWTTSSSLVLGINEVVGKGVVSRRRRLWRRRI